MTWLIALSAVALAFGAGRVSVGLRGCERCASRPMTSPGLWRLVPVDGPQQTDAPQSPASPSAQSTTG